MKRKKSESLFVDILGETPITKIWDFLITGRNFEYTITDIIRETKVGTQQAYNVIRKFEKEGFVIKKVIGNYKIFKLNKRNKKVKSIIKLYLNLIKDNT